jgi:hypothetical protein
MKNVAATSGQRVSFAIRFFRLEIACVGYWAGRDRELNFYFLSPERHSLWRCVKRVRMSKNTRAVSACKKNLHSRQIIFNPYSDLCRNCYGDIRFRRPSDFGTIPTRTDRISTDYVRSFLLCDRLRRLLAIYLVQESLVDA